MAEGRRNVGYPSRKPHIRRVSHLLFSSFKARAQFFFHATLTVCLPSLYRYIITSLGLYGFSSPPLSYRRFINYLYDFTAAFDPILIFRPLALVAPCMDT